MKNLLLILVPLLLSMSAYGQEGSGFSLGLHLSPDMAYRQVFSFTGTGDWIRGVRNKTEMPKFGYRGGLFGQWELSPQASLQVGLSYANKGYEMTWREPLKALEPDDPHIPVNYHMIHSYHFLVVPVNANYYFNSGQVRYFISGGLAANVPFGKSVTTLHNFVDRVEERKSGLHSVPVGFRPLNLSAQIGFGFDRALAEGWVLRIHPEFRHDIISITNASFTPLPNEPGIKGYFYSAGINVGVVRKLR